MPTGTGKTACLLSLITSYQYAHPERGKLVYCTRTVPEMDSVMAELVEVLEFRERCLEAPAEGGEGSKKRKGRGAFSGMGANTNPGGAGGSGVLGLCLSSRRNMCVHEQVMEESDRELVDNACRQMTASWVRAANEKEPGSVKTCGYYEKFEEEVRRGGAVEGP